MATRPITVNKTVADQDTIPFYRNVKLIGILAQVIFVIILLVTGTVIYLNVTRALRASNLPANFDFLGVRAGIPIAESPIRYTTSDPYWRAMVIGFLNTLKVSLVGVVLATLLGILVGVLRLSPNWLLRQIAGAFVEVVRNTPLAVQIVFWFTAVLTPLPPRISNPIQLPGNVLLSNLGIALPWLENTYLFVNWLPWLGGGILAGFLAYGLRKWQIERADLHGNPWWLGVLVFLLIAIGGYVSIAPEIPDTVATDFRADRGRGQVFLDTNQNGELDGDEQTLPYVPARVRIESGQLRTTSQNTTESRRNVSSVVRFPLIRASEVGDAEVIFADPEAAREAGLLFHFTHFPSEGVLYQDRNDNGAFDNGEQVDDDGSGFTGVAMLLRVYDFERRLVANRDGQVRIPRFDPVRDGNDSDGNEEVRAPTSPSGGLFGAPANTPDADTSTDGSIDATFEVLPLRPLVLSTPSIPVTNYIGGITLSTSFLALLLALVIHTAGFIAEIVRAGIQAVPKGQREAAKTLGLSPWQTFSIVTFPQALRIILPPMISQYLNLSKNSSLAPLAAYVELFAISVIIANQTGATIPVILIIIASYLLISFTFAFILNIVNDRMALVER
jgi:His/Glu/Gln/Arg/opine family amino acid ABC transporter permease subunit